MHRPIFVWIYVILFLMQTACATSPSVGSASSEDVRKSVGTVGVAARFAPKVKFQKPEHVQVAGDSSAAGRTAGRALGATWKACGQGMIASAPFIIGPVVVLYGCIVATPFVAIGGAIYGNSRAEARANRAVKKARKSEVKALRPVIGPAVAALANERPLHTRLLQQLPARTNSTAVSVTETGRLRYKDLAAEGVDTVLEITAPRLDVSRENALVLTAEVRLVRVADRKELYANAHTFEVPSRSVSEWTANDGEALRAALVGGYQSLADGIADELFGRPALPSMASTNGF